MRIYYYQYKNSDSPQSLEQWTVLLKEKGPVTLDLYRLNKIKTESINVHLNTLW